MDVTVKEFKALTLEELYGILQLRSEVFVVEQDCVYQDLDGKDQKALHVVGLKNNKVIAYARLFKPGEYFKEASIGRVVVSPSTRKEGYGVEIMRASIQAVKEQYNETTMRISAQKYLLKFYNSLGFVQEGEEYLEDGIPHVAMVKS